MCHSTFQVPLYTCNPILKETEGILLSQDTEIKWQMFELSKVGITDHKVALTTGQ